MDWFADNETLLQQIGVFAIAAASLQVALRAGVFSLVGAGTWMIGAYAAAIALDDGMPPFVALLIALALAALVSLALSLLTIRIDGLTLAMATIAFDLIVVVVIRNWESLTGGALGLYAIPVSVSSTGLAVIVVAVAVVLMLVERGRQGRAVVALREDVQAAAAVGVPVPLARHLVTTVSGVLGALSGAIYAMMFNAIAPDQGGFHLVTLLLSMVVIGGIDSWRGAYVGAALLMFLPEISRTFNEWNGLIYGALMVLVVVWAPEGVLGGLRKVRELLPRRAGPSRAEASSS